MTDVSQTSVSRPAEGTKPTSWVYFIRAGEDGPIKIGFTGGSPHARMRDLQTGNHERLRLLGAVPGTSADEGALHQRFADLRGEGEWFRPEPRLVAFVEGALWVAREEQPEDDGEDDIEAPLGMSRDDMMIIAGFVEAALFEKLARWEARMLGFWVRSDAELRRIRMIGQFVRGLQEHESLHPLGIDIYGRDSLNSAYDELARSLEAHKVERAIYKRDGDRCRKCGDTTDLVVHNTGSGEQVICFACFKAWELEEVAKVSSTEGERPF